MPSDGRERPVPLNPRADGAGAEPALEPTGSLGAQLAAGAAPKDRSAAWMWLLFAAIGFVAGQIIAAIFVGVAAAVEGVNSSSLSAIARLSAPPTWYVVSTLLGLWVGFIGSPYLASTVRGTRRFLRDMGLRFRWVDLAGLPIGFASQFAVALLYVPIAPHVHNFNQRFEAPSQRLTGGSHGAGTVIIDLLTVIGAPFFEELFFRGLLLRSLARLFGSFAGWVGPTAAVVTTGVLFGLAHAESLQLLGLAAFGIALSAIAYRTGRLGMNMFAHAAFNLTAVAAVVTAGTGSWVHL